MFVKSLFSDILNEVAKNKRPVVEMRYEIIHSDPNLVRLISTLMIDCFISTFVSSQHEIVLEK
ncbi:CLUMA_CG014832, isoform A [Clunio marinus]|uniref:CLUMA_CG014832, isoform A n=1 Tax=Clunio marinus TaxID=568069 RepID=A0A1J1ISC6_9DIPT|nr:CLUMA_CG014832, isoform A [Clunio marinus]